MRDLSPSELKSILHSKRANLFYLEHCRVLVKGGRVEYVTEQGADSLYWNIPIANTTTILLGTGTSITQSAVRELAKAGVLIGFCGGGGTPLYSANEMDVEIAWFCPQSEYRPTEHLQRWVSFWFDPQQRLSAAKRFQVARLDRLRTTWLTYRPFLDAGLKVSEASLTAMIADSTQTIHDAPDAAALLIEEARLTKQLYKLVAQATKYGDFSRAKHGEGTDPANRLLDHGNYLAYGQAASATWVLGLPHGLAVLHGKTRRGGLVFDVADLVKDALILPQAFISARRGDEEQEFRAACLENFARTESLDFMIDTLKETAAIVSGHS